ncbi:SET domain-containing protein [Daldinia caldariorum]|uniref:SET domain-containing protein n=1 Tax=Daldinia caldariorum TaxID=326644 RepID=UPI002007DA28|nr:SET domain-containing protein [Daldinia caldariorum]KAI1466445.1 SET domain-containing protein [Daldinia caldariorum]
MRRFLLLFQFTAALAKSVQSHLDSQICAVPSPLFVFDTQICVSSEASPGGHSGPLDEVSLPLKAWKPGGICRGARADKFCVFTNEAFNHGEGVSVITTAKSITTISTRPAFLTKKTEVFDSKSELTVPYREVEIPGKDIGLVATRAIRAGELIMARTPAIMVNEKAINTLGRKAVSELLIRATLNLPSRHRESLLKLSTHSSASDYGDKLYKILQTNSFRTGYHDGINPFYSLFTEVSRLNHDCRPTCAYYFDHRDFHHKVMAVRDVAEDEELTIAYYDPLQSHSTRQEKLQKEWGFKCSCQRCSANATAIAESDRRVSQIHALWKELDDHSATSKGSAEKARLLISLYEEEGILGRLNEAYYRAAIEYVGIGDVEKATEYAALCIENGLLFVGPDRPFIKNMQELIANPTGNPKWKFRLKDN